MPETAASDRYLAEYGTDLVARWDELVGWSARARSEGSFFTDMLRAYGARRVLDAATGTGFHAVAFADAGFEVSAVDGAPEMVAQARANLDRQGHHAVLCEVADWRRLADTVPGPFDAVVCLGNSFGHLFSAADLAASLRGFHRVLAPGGLLVLDSRNYDSILDGTGSCCKQRYCCVGAGAGVSLAKSGEDRVTITYSLNGEEVQRIETCPWRRATLTRAIQDAGFSMPKVYGDYSRDFEPAGVEFYVYAARKVAQ